MHSLRNCFRSIWVVGLFVCFTACNSIGPYYGSVFRLDEDTYRVYLSTWIGGGSGWPYDREKLKEREELRQKAEKEAAAALRRAGIDFEACVLRGFIPYEGGHIDICLIAGKRAAVNRWIAMSDQAYEQWLRDHYSGEGEIAKFEGRLPQMPKSKKAPNQTP